MSVVVKKRLRIQFRLDKCFCISVFDKCFLQCTFECVNALVKNILIDKFSENNAFEESTNYLTKSYDNKLKAKPIPIKWLFCIWKTNSVHVMLNCKILDIFIKKIYWKIIVIPLSSTPSLSRYRKISIKPSRLLSITCKIPFSRYVC